MGVPGSIAVRDLSHVGEDGIGTREIRESGQELINGISEEGPFHLPAHREIGGTVGPKRQGLQG